MAREPSLTLNVNGKKYGGWTSFRISRGLDRVVGNFVCDVSERWPAGGQTWQIIPQSRCVVMAGNDTILTGFIDDYEASIEKQQHRVLITGRSKTQDLVDCNSESLGNFFDSTLLATAHALVDPFSIGIVDQLAGTDKAGRTTSPLQHALLADSNLGQQLQSGLSLPDTIVQPGESVFNFLERLARVQGVLLTDDEFGNLVLTDAGGSGNAATALIQGQNILSASVRLDYSLRFSDYVVRSQNGLKAPGLQVDPSIYAKVSDEEILRYRPTSIIAETAMDTNLAQRRAQYMKNHAYGMSVRAKVKVEGWRQSDGTLWRPNQTVAVQLDELQLREELLVVAVDFNLSNEEGFVTDLELGRIQGYTPDPAQVSVKPPSVLSVIRPVQQ